MAINLRKGSRINLKKFENDLSRVTIGLGWDVVEQKGLMSKLFGKKEDEYDLDVIAVLLDENGKIANSGKNLKNGDVIFYNNLKHPTGKVWLTGDNRIGAGEGDDEQVICELDGRLIPEAPGIRNVVTRRRL
jgi:stress response protein SCP2